MKFISAASLALALAVSANAVPAFAAPKAKPAQATKVSNDPSCSGLCNWWTTGKAPKPHNRNKYSG